MTKLLSACFVACSLSSVSLCVLVQVWSLHAFGPQAQCGAFFCCQAQALAVRPVRAGSSLALCISVFHRRSVLEETHEFGNYRLKIWWRDLALDAPEAYIRQP